MEIPASPHIIDVFRENARSQASVRRGPLSWIFGSRQAQGANSHAEALKIIMAAIEARPDLTVAQTQEIREAKKAYEAVFAKRSALGLFLDERLGRPGQKDPKARGLTPDEIEKIALAVPFIVSDAEARIAMAAAQLYRAGYRDHGHTVTRNSAEEAGVLPGMEPHTQLLYRAISILGAYLLPKSNINYKKEKLSLALDIAIAMQKARFKRDDLDFLGKKTEDYKKIIEPRIDEDYLGVSDRWSVGCWDDPSWFYESPYGKFLHRFMVGQKPCQYRAKYVLEVFLDSLDILEKLPADIGRYSEDLVGSLEKNQNPFFAAMHLMTAERLAGSRDAHVQRFGQILEAYQYRIYKGWFGVNNHRAQALEWHSIHMDGLEDEHVRAAQQAAAFIRRAEECTAKDIIDVFKRCTERVYDWHKEWEKVMAITSGLPSKQQPLQPYTKIPDLQAVLFRGSFTDLDSAVS